MFFYCIICFWLSAAVSDHALTWSGSTQLDTIKDCSKCWSVELCCWPESRAFILGSLEHFIYSACTIAMFRPSSQLYYTGESLFVSCIMRFIGYYRCRVSFYCFNQSISLQLVQIWLYYICFIAYCTLIKEMRGCFVWLWLE